MEVIDEPIRVAIGTEPKQWLASEVLKASILRRTSRPVQFVESWTPEKGWHPALAKLPKIPRGTAFNLWRWVTPTLWPTGKAIYLDADQVLLADIGELWDSLRPGYVMACVCNAQGVFGKKVPEPNKVQTSVMVCDCEQLMELLWRKRPIEAVSVGTMKYADMMQAAWVDRSSVCEIDPAWNHFSLHNERTKLLHFSHVASQPWHNEKNPTTDVWLQCLREAVEDGYIDESCVYGEVRRGHIIDSCYKRYLELSRCASR